MYPNFGQNPMMGQPPSFQQNPIMGQLPSYGQMPSLQQPLGMAFNQQPQQQQHHGMNPMMLMSPLLAGSHSMLPAMFGIGGLLAKHFGAFK